MKTWIAATLAAVITAFAITAQASQRYIIQASTWGAAQNAAVAAAGGTVKLGHSGSGVAIAESNDPNFLSKIASSSAIQFADQDIHLLWTPPPTKVDDIHLLDIHLLDIHLLDIHLLDIHLLDIHLLDIHLLD